MLKKYLTDMFGKDNAGVQFSFGMGENARVCPGYFLLIWRDTEGFNPGFAYEIKQSGAVDPHLLPNGYRFTGRYWLLFGKRS